MKGLLKDDYIKRINMVVEYINNHINEEMYLKKLSEISNFSEYHFHRIFKAYKRETLGTYISRIRIERAAILLKYSETSIENIALSVGYENPSAFSRAFKLFFKVPPIEYRNNNNIYIKRPLEHGVLINLEPPQMIHMRDKTVIYVELVGTPDAKDFPNAYNKLWRLVNKKDFSKNQPLEHIAIYHDDPKITTTDKFRSYVCLSIDQPIKPLGEVGVKKISGGLYAKFTHCGSYSNLEATYNKIFGEWLFNSELELRNEPFFEKFVNDPSKTLSENLKTEIYIPVQYYVQNNKTSGATERAHFSFNESY